MEVKVTGSRVGEVDGLSGSTPHDRHTSPLVKPDVRISRIRLSQEVLERSIHSSTSPSWLK
jgi:hypothetical protein